MLLTGIKKIDQLLSSINYGILIDVFGANGIGKTQLTMQISVNLLKQNSGQILYHDTTGGFRPERMIEIMKIHKMNIDLLNKVKIRRIINTAEQIHQLKNVLLSKNISLLVIDNVTDLFSFEYKSKFLEKNILFMKYMHDLSLIAIKKKLPVILTNNIYQINNVDEEILRNSISMFTHVKIHLLKKYNTYTGILSTPWINKIFSYDLSSSGLIEL